MPNWTSQQFEEVKKCRKSFRYFAESYLKITNPGKGLVPFRLYDFQDRVINEFEQYPNCITKKFRQAGFTTLTCMWFMWKCIFFNDQRMMIVSKTDREATAVGRMVANAKRELPEWLQPEMRNDNDHEKEFIETNSVMWFYTPGAGRSKSLTYLAVDEAAFIQGMDDHWAALYPTLSNNGRCIVISTVNGIGNWYEVTYHNAEQKRNDFHIVHVDWHEHPSYNNPEWEKRNRGNLGPKKFAQEIEGSFLGSGETYIPGELIVEYEKDVCQEPIRKALPEYDTIPEETFDPKLCLLPNKDYEPGAMWIWENPKPGREYIIAADVSEGIGDEGDYSAFVIFDIQSLVQVAEFYSNTIQPYKFAQVLKGVGDIYNTALIVVENSLGPGQGVCERLQHTLVYENLHFTSSATGRDKPGLNMNKVVRPICLDAMKTCMLNKIVKIRSTRITRELKTFIYNNKKQRAESQGTGNHDDLVICLAAALHVADVSSRDVPVFSLKQNHEMDLITQSFHNDEYRKLREELESGLMDDLLEEKVDEEIELLPKLMFDLKRPNHQILKEFGW